MTSGDLSRPARRTPRVVRLLPSPETLNLLVGVVSATAINLVTAAGLGEVARTGQVVLSGGLMLAAALVIGALAIWLTHTRDDALANLPTSISLGERRALLRDAVSARARTVGAAVALAAVLLAAAVTALLV